MVQLEDWEELVRILRGVEEKMPASNDDASSAVLESICQDLRGFHATAAMLEMKEVEEVALSLENCLKQSIDDTADQQAAQIFKLALRSLLEEMEHAANNGGDGIDLKGVQSILDMEEAAENEGQVAINDGHAQDFSRLRHLVTGIGGELSVDEADPDGATFQLRFEATPQNLKQVEHLLSPKDPTALLDYEFPDCGDRTGKVLDTIREFMHAMSSGDMNRSQEILLHLAEQHDQAGLYNEIGLMARELHNSLKHFMDTLDPTLREMVENKLPDSGNRLEHILELTEKAANTTLDHVEAMQKRNSEDQTRLAQVRELLGELQAIGEQAQTKLARGLNISDDLNASLLQTHVDLITVLTAQDYQDLTGQIIMKIMTLLKDLELKLVNVIRVFGLKADLGKGDLKEELYGPAHNGKTESLHSQDDVDALLADFGF